MVKVLVVAVESSYRLVDLVTPGGPSSCITKASPRLVPTSKVATRTTRSPKLHILKMPQLDEHTEQYFRDAEAGVRRRTSWAWDSFTNFALRDNVLEVAVGLM